MENQPKLNSSKEVIAFLAERFPRCFSAEGEARPLKIGIFQDLVERVGGEMNLSKTQLRSALRLYTSSWRYLYGVKPGATRVVKKALNVNLALINRRRKRCVRLAKKSTRRFLIFQY